MQAGLLAALLHGTQHAADIGLGLVQLDLPIRGSAELPVGPPAHGADGEIRERSVLGRVVRPGELVLLGRRPHRALLVGLDGVRRDREALPHRECAPVARRSGEAGVEQDQRLHPFRQLVDPIQRDTASLEGDRVGSGIVAEQQAPSVGGRGPVPGEVDPQHPIGTHLTRRIGDGSLDLLPRPLLEQVELLLGHASRVHQVVVDRARVAPCVRHWRQLHVGLDPDEHRRVVRRGGPGPQRLVDLRRGMCSQQRETEGEEPVHDGSG
jgi:hypothetical protein